jgi:acetyl esterase/lipase
MHSPRRPPNHRRLAVASAVAALALACTGASANADPHIPDATLAAVKPGHLFQSWPIKKDVPQGYKGYRILYRSTGTGGRAVAVTGVVFYPVTRGEPPRDVVAWAHPTTGISQRCAPSLLPSVAPTIQGLEEFAALGLVVVATDYIGLGTDDVHPYLVGESEAATVLDSIRAVRTIAEANAGPRFVVWGHSQGGHATLFTGEQAATYAPELELMGVAAAAPVTDIAAMYADDRPRESGRALIAMVIRSWTRVFGLKLQDMVQPTLEPRFSAFADDCIQTLADFTKFERDDGALPHDFLKVNPVAYPPLRTLMDRNRAGRLPKGVPAFLAQGTADNVVPPPLTEAYVKRLCAAGTPVTLKMIPDGIHAFAARDSAADAARWIADRFAGKPALSNCPTKEADGG